jgi:hypothetical protein
LSRQGAVAPAAKWERSPTPIGFSPMTLTERDGIGSFAKKLAFAFCTLSLVAPGAVEKKSEPVPGTNPDESLSRQLDEGKGMIDPPPVGDAKIQAPAPAPNSGTTPVIPPPGTPRGDQSIQPQVAGTFTVFVKA